MYSRAGAVCVRTATSPCGGMQVYKQLQKRYLLGQRVSEKGRLLENHKLPGISMLLDLL